MASAPAASRPPLLSRLRTTSEPLVVIAGAAIALGLGLRLSADIGHPLWLDETWTGAISAQNNLGEVLYQIYQDVNGPLFYVVMYFWSQVFGISNEALRVPALAFGAAAAMIALIPVNGIRVEVRLIWCGLLALWIEGLYFSQEARCYTLLLALSVGCSAAFAHMLANPTRRHAAVWAVLGSLAILTHYHAAPLVASQGIAYLLIHRLRAVRTWPAALVFVPCFAWIWIHLPRMLQFGDSEIAWYPLVNYSHFFWIVHFLFGDVLLIPGLIAIGGLALMIGAKPQKADEAVNSDSIAWTVVATAAIGAVAEIGIGVVRPSFTARYLIPFVPGLLLGLALATSALGRRWALAPSLVVLLFATCAVSQTTNRRLDEASVYNFEKASRFLMGAKPQRLVFLWDHPATAIEAPRQLDIVGGFFFRRAGHAIEVDPVYLQPGEDPNRALLAAAKPGSAILWLYDLRLTKTAAIAFSPRIEDLDRAWRCRNFGNERIGVIACDQRTAPS